MHELSVCLALMQQVERVAAEHGARQVRRIVLEIGPLSGVEPALLEHSFPLAAAGTLAEAASLEIETGPVVVRCVQCGGESEVPANRLLCGQCGDFRTRVIRGEEMLLKSMDLDLEAGPGAARKKQEALEPE